MGVSFVGSKGWKRGEESGVTEASSVTGLPPDTKPHPLSQSPLGVNSLPATAFSSLICGPSPTQPL